MLRAVVGYAAMILVATFASLGLTALFELIASFVEWREPELDMAQARSLLLWWLFIFGLMVYHRYKEVKDDK